MKRNPILRPATGVCLLWLLLAFRPVPPQIEEGITNLLNVQDIGLRRNQPTIFSFAVQQDDMLIFDCEDCEILLDKDRISMQLSSPDGAEIIPLNQGMIRNGVSVRGSGLYRLQIETKARFKFLRIKDLQLTLESSFGSPDPEEARTVLDLERVYIGEEQGRNRTHPRFVYDLLPADTLHVQVAGLDESVPDALEISFGIVGQLSAAPVSLSSSGGFTIPISQRGTFFVEFSASNRRFYDLKKDFYNLTIRRVPKTKEEFVDFGGGAPLPTEEEEKEDPMAALLAQLVEMQKEEPKAGLQPLNRISPPIFSVAPIADLSNSNCTCGQIPLPAADIMVYWLGVNEKGHQAFRKIEQAHLDQDRLSPGLFHSYAKSVLLNGTPNNYLFNATNLDVTFYEDVEWAIVTEQGKDEFESGKTPRPTNVLKYGGRINSAYGYILSVQEGNYFLCFRNDNPRSAVQVAIDFQLFNQALISGN